MPERFGSDTCYAFANADTGQFGAGLECIAINGSDAIGNGHAGQPAVIKRSITDFGDARANLHASQLVATVESRALDTGHTVANGATGQAGATPKRLASDAGDIVGNRYPGQAGALPERFGSDGRDAAGDRHAGQVGAFKCTVTDAGDWQAIDRSRNTHCSASAFVSRDADGATAARIDKSVGGGARGGLGVRWGGKRQQQEHRQYS